jgi:hypothetical protein
MIKRNSLLLLRQAVLFSEKSQKTLENLYPLWYIEGVRDTRWGIRKKLLYNFGG